MGDVGYESLFLYYDYSESDDDLDRIAYYRFKSKKSNLFYIVRVEEYKKHVYGVKFYLKKMQNSSRKYSYITNTFEPRVIVLTIFRLLMTILKNDSYASFMFIGNADEGGTHENTRRYRLYCRLVENYISETHFLHIRNDLHSLYLLVNRQQLESVNNFADIIAEKFVNRFIFED